MTLFIVGLLLFFVMHAIPMMPRLRDGLIGSIGRSGYQGMFAIGSLGGLFLIFYYRRDAGFYPVWDPPVYLNHLLLITIPIALILMLASIFRGKISAVMRHPLLVGTKLWAISHLLVNGDLISIILFGAFLVWASAARVSIRLVGRSKPLNPQPAPLPGRNDIIAVVGGLVAAYVLAYFHSSLFGPSVLPAGMMF